MDTSLPTKEALLIHTDLVLGLNALCIHVRVDFIETAVFPGTKASVSFKGFEYI